MDSFIDTTGSTVLDAEGNPTSYIQKVYVVDYAELEGNSDKMPNLVKKVTVEISYLNNGKTEKVELSTLLTAKES